MNSKLIVHIVRMLIGYSAAGLVADIMLGIIDLIQNPDKLEEPVKHFEQFGTLALAMLAFAFPVWLICVIACEYNNARQLRWYALAGAIAALFPLLIFGLLFESLARAPWLLLSLVVIGAAGGTTYWAIAGRKAGSWKRTVQ
jgi:hypothetical protein